MPRGRAPGPPPPPRAAQHPTEAIKVTVKSAITGDDIASLWLPLETRIAELKRELEPHCKVPLNYQQLLHHSSAQELRNQDTLESADSDTALQTATKERVLVLVRQAPEEHVSLHLACTLGDILLVGYLAQFKANVNEVCSQFQTSSLHIAARQGNTDMVEKLLALQADAHIKDCRGYTALHLAACVGVARALLDAAADCLCRSGNGRLASTSILPLFALAGDKSMVEYLLQHRAVANAPYQTYPVCSEQLPARVGGLHYGELVHIDGNPALHCALKNEVQELNVDLIALLASVTDLTAPGKHGATALHLACSSGSTAACMAILQELEDPMLLCKIRQQMLPCKDRSELQLSQWLLRACWSAVLRQICLEGTESSASERVFRCLDALDRHGNRPLHEAAFHGHQAVVNFLLDKGAHVHVKNKQGESPLWRAASQLLANVCKLLLDARADVNERDERGNNLLHKVARGPRKLIRLLIAAQVNTTVKNRDGHTPLQVAEAYGNEVSFARHLNETDTQQTKD